MRKLGNFFRPVPFIRFIIPLILGIILGEFYPIPKLYYTGIVLILLLIFLAFKSIPNHRKWIFGIITYLFLFVVGHTLVVQHDERNHQNYLSTFKLQQKVQCIGIVQDLPVAKNKIEAQIQLESIFIDNSWKKVSGNVKAYFAKDTSSYQLFYGDKIIFSARFFPPQKNLNPKSFDFAQFLHFQNIHYTAHLKSEDWNILENHQGNSILSWSFSLRKRAIEILKKEIPSVNEFAVASALIVGYKDEITEDVSLAYRHTGAMHVLAVSGLHVGIVYWLISLLFKFIKSRRRSFLIFKLFISLVLIWAFALVTGASPSVLRASVMFSFVIIGDSFSQEKNIYNTLAVSAFFLLLFNPYLLFNIGFQLSYLAVIGIVFFQNLIYKSWYVKNRVGKFIWKLTSVSLAAQIITLPISIFYFHQIPTYFWLSGLIVVPAAPIILVLGLLIFFFSLFSSTIVSALAFVLMKFLWVVNAVIFMIQKLPIHIISDIHITFYELVLLYIVVAMIMIWIYSANKKYLWTALLFLCITCISFSARKISYLYQKKLIVYHTQGNLIDYIEGKEVYTFKNEELSEKNEDFAASMYRAFYGAKKIKENILFKNNFITIKGLKIYVLNENYYQRRSIKNIDIDIIIIQNNPFINFKNLVKEFNCKKIIVDGSNSYGKIKFWKKAAKEYNIEFHNTKEHGAFIY